jgi:periplasmic divalent cation tolerance protein
MTVTSPSTASHTLPRSDAWALPETLGAGHDVRVVLCMLPAGADAPGPGHEPLHARIARALVQEKLAACVNVIPGATSYYEWQGTFCEDQETLLVIKTTAARVTALCEALVALHPYEVPEVIALPVAAGHVPYLAWVLRQTA